MEAHDINVHAAIEAAGLATVYNGSTVYILPLTDKMIARVNETRKATIKPRLKRDAVNSMPWVNAEYVYEYLTIIESDLKDENKPHDKSVLFYALIPKKDDGTKFKLYLALEEKYKMILPPLPTNPRRGQ